MKKINLLRAFKNDLILRSPGRASLDDVPLSYFSFLVEESTLSSSTTTSLLEEAEAHEHAKVAEAVDIAETLNSDLTPLLEEQDRLIAKQNSTQAPLL